MHHVTCILNFTEAIFMHQKQQLRYVIANILYLIFIAFRTISKGYIYLSSCISISLIISLDRYMLETGNSVQW